MIEESQSKFLFIGEKTDEDILYLISLLEEKGYKDSSFICTPSDLKDLIALYMVKEERETCEFTLDGKELKGREIKSVLDLNTLDYSIRYDDTQKKCEEDYIYMEWTNCLISLCYYMPFTFISNPPHKAYPLNRVKQLYYAKELGFKQPYTMITNWPDQIKKNIFKNGQLSGEKTTIQTLGKRHRKYFSWMKEITLEEFEKNEDAYREIPAIWRRQKQSLYDVRIYAIKNDLIGVKIDSQKVDETKVDWRVNKNNDIYESYEIPETLAKKVAKFMSLNELTFCAFDFTVVDEMQEPLFLEVDIKPRWRFIEKRSKVYISSLVLEMLIKGKE